MSSYYDPTSWALDPSSQLPTVILTICAGAYILCVVLGLTILPDISFFLRQVRELAVTLSNTSFLRDGAQKLAGAFTSGRGNGPAGLHNNDNACYQNSVLQGLASLPSLRDYLADMMDEYPCLTDDSANSALYSTVTQLNDPDNKGKSFRNAKQLRVMSTLQQQDAQEYYSRILDDMDKEIRKAARNKCQSDASQVDAAKNSEKSEALDEKKEADEKARLAEELARTPLNPLDGLLAQRVGCTSCGYTEGLKFEAFNCITVSLGGSRDATDISNCLDEYTKLELINEVECSKCTLLHLQKTLSALAADKADSPFAEKLRAANEMLSAKKIDDNVLVKELNVPKKNWIQSTKSKQMVIGRAPKSLVVHVNRSVFNERTGALSKNNAKVAYPHVLDIGKWCLGDAPSGSREPDIDPELEPKDPGQSMLADRAAEPETPSPFQYRLRAVVAHSGVHGYGHYVCFRSAPITAKTDEKDDGDGEKEQDLGEQWWRFSDAIVRPVSEDQAQRESVFMLFYERIDDSVVPAPPAEDEEEGMADAPALTIKEEEEVSEKIQVPEEAPIPHDDTITEAKAQEPQKDPALPVPLASPQGDLSRGASEEEEGPTGDEEASEEESEDGTSTAVSPDRQDAAKTLPEVKRLSPQLMRTAGNAGRSRAGSKSLPLVSAT